MSAQTNSNPEHFRKKLFLKARKLFLIMLGLSILMPALALMDFLRPSTESIESWFQRSGSIMVLFAVVAEMQAYQMFDVFKPVGFVSEEKV